MTVYWSCKAQKINASKETRENSLKVKLETWVPIDLFLELDVEKLIVSPCYFLMLNLIALYGWFSSVN